MKQGIFITGTDTGVGKTLISSLLVSYRLAQHWSVRYFKPIQTGGDSDCDTVKNLTACSEDTLIRPLFSFPKPLAPFSAAKEDNQTIDIQVIVDYWQTCEAGFYIVEGAGGLLVPLAKNTLIRDLIKALNLPLLIVASTRLGTMNHTLLTIEAAQKAEIPIKGIIFSGEAEPGFFNTIKQFAQLPISHIPWLKDHEKSSLHLASLYPTWLRN